MINSDQIRAARALLRLDQSDVAERAGVSIAMVRRIEAGTEAASSNAAASISAVLTRAGAEFIPNGVRRRSPRSPQEVEARYRKIMEISERSAKILAENPGGFSEDDLFDENGLPA